MNKIVKKQQQQEQNNLIVLNNIIRLKKRLAIPYPLKNFYNCQIPLKIYQTWHTKDLPEKLRVYTNNIKVNNPKFEYNLFDDNDCRSFIEQNFPNDVLWAFDNLIPGAYKADLWRYCILYKTGGIYLDIKYKPNNRFKFINLTEKDHWVLDADGRGIYNALMVCKAGNQILLQAINQIVEHVRNKYYGENCLAPTGPILLSRYFSQDDKNGFQIKHEVLLEVEPQQKLITFNNFIIFKMMSGYYNIQENHKKTRHYSVLWHERNIYA
jgi:mannosyltransferase OCH1-like enzyme